MGCYIYLSALLTFGLQWGLKIVPIVFSASITEYPGMTQGRYEGMTIWIPPKPTYGPGHLLTQSLGEKGQYLYIFPDI